jgi:hypothetical protein
LDITSKAKQALCALVTSKAKQALCALDITSKAKQALQKLNKRFAHWTSPQKLNKRFAHWTTVLIKNLNILALCDSAFVRIYNILDAAIVYIRLLASCLLHGWGQKFQDMVLLSCQLADLHATLVSDSIRESLPEEKLPFVILSFRRKRGRRS